MIRRWNIRDSDVEASRSFAEKLGVTEVTAQILLNRGLTDCKTAEAFLGCHLSSVHDPKLLCDIERSRSRIRHAVRHGEMVLVWGDYDVDGITAVTVLYSAIRSLGGNASYYIPNRLEDGYGLSLPAIHRAHKRGVSLIVTVDCGTSALKEIEYARSLGIDVIVTDHHEISSGGLPGAYCVINPHRGECNYPFKYLAGVGLAYKLASVLLEGTDMAPDDFLDLVALGTVADIVPQTGENRVLTKHGLKKLSRTDRAGLKALIEIAGLEGKEISSGHVGFMLGPRINAMGRIGAPEIALRLLLSEDSDEASELAKALDTENRNRQKIESGILSEALEKVEREVNFGSHRVIVIESPAWHQGVIGIVASRIVERYYRPTILISTEGNPGRGSGRSVRNFNLFDALVSCREHLAGFGGHEGACGLSIEKGSVDAFRDSLNKYAIDHLKDEDLIPALDIEAAVGLADLSRQVVEELEHLSPFGPKNPRPLLASKRLIVKDSRSIARGGFKLYLHDGKVTREAVTFGRSSIEMPRQGDTVDIAYTPALNTWQGITSLQLELKDVRPAK